MANPVVRAWGIFYKGKKVAEAHENNPAINAGRTALFGSEGYFTHSKGAVTSKLTFRYVIPVGGTQLDFLTDTVLQNDVDIQQIIGGKKVLVTYAITENSLQADTKTGVCEGTLTLEGGKPQIN